MGTADPYPVFTAWTKFLMDAYGFAGIEVMAYLVTLLALGALFVLARSISPAPSNNVALLSVGLVAASLVVWPTGLRAISLFQGLAAQYLISRPAYWQPSSAGVLILLAGAVWIGSRRAPWGSTAAMAMTLMAVVVHPTYAVVVLVALSAGFVADLIDGISWKHVVGYAATSTVVGGLGLAVSPISAGDVTSEALERFTFERIPHHTLISSWRLQDVALILVVCTAAILARPLRNGVWLSTWLGVCLAVSLAAAVYVEQAHSITLALLMPWRVSVLLVPIAGTVIAVRISLWLREVSPGNWWFFLGSAALLVAIVGSYRTVLNVSPRESDPAVALVVRVHPKGTGLIPLGAENVRLNADVPVYVDAKAPPYGADDLQRWWNRFDEVRRLEERQDTYCESLQAIDVDWLLTDKSTSLWRCMSGWRILGESQGWTVMQRRAEHTR